MCAENITTVVGECRSSKRDGEVDVVIVGAGVAGSALAYTLGKFLDGIAICASGLGVMRSSWFYPSPLCGIDAQQVFGYALFKDGKHIRLSYPLEKFHSDVAGRSFHNGRFIQRMRKKAVSLLKFEVTYAISVRLEQGTVTSLLEEKGVIKGVQYKTKDSQELSVCAPFTIVCDGCFSNLRRSLCNPKPVASTINTLAGTLYKVFCASPDPARKEMRQACFDYLSLGGQFSE
ncbi:Squalene monooxygenase [Vigna angularis]|uniref:Squalene monooxygenase n=1 Tax=Phaseolus angularis TaxID=3914 RepID=A0A8T0KN07_PHAAN|nr:Squalene monooxygenase [Vigna angularis]